MKWMGTNNKAIAFLRVSSLGQEGNTSRMTQERDVKSYSSALGLELVEICYLVESAKDSSMRKKYKEKDRWADKNSIRHRIFHRYDREARNLTDNENTETKVRQDKVDLHYALDKNSHARKRAPFPT